MLTAARAATRRSRTARSTPCSSRSPTCRAGSSASASPATTGPSRCKAAREPVHACNYLLAVDVDMNPLPGYQFANWDQGYGDVAVQPDLATHPPDPVARRDRARDVRRGRRAHRRTGRGLAPPHPPAPGRARRRRSATRCMFASELEFFLFRESLDEAAAKGYAEPHAALAGDRGLPHPPDDARRVRDPRDPQRDGRRGRARSSSRRAKRAAASTRSTSRTRPRSRWPTAT